MVHTKLQKKLLYRNGPCFILVSLAFILKPCRVGPQIAHTGFLSVNTAKKLPVLNQ